MNQLAKQVTLLEGKKEQISIAQVKEVLSCVKVVTTDPKAMFCLLKYLLFK